MSGEIIHRYLEELLDDKFECEKEFVRTSPKGITVTAHPDAIHKADNVVVEIESPPYVSRMSLHHKFREGSI